MTLFRAVVKFCITNKLFIKNMLRAATPLLFLNDASIRGRVLICSRLELHQDLKFVYVRVAILLLD